MADVITNADKLACAKRELKFRQHIYAKRVEEGKMSAGKAAHEIACIEAIIEDYEVIVSGDRLL